MASRELHQTQLDISLGSSTNLFAEDSDGEPTVIARTPPKQRPAAREFFSRYLSYKDNEESDNSVDFNQLPRWMDSPRPNQASPLPSRHRLNLSTPSSSSSSGTGRSPGGLSSSSSATGETG